MTWTLGTVLVSAGLPPDTQVAIERIDGYRVAWWTDTIAGQRGQWWVLLSATGNAALSFGWCPGGARDRQIEVAIKLSKIVGATPAQEGAAS